MKKCPKCASKNVEEIETGLNFGASGHNKLWKCLDCEKKWGG